MHGPSFAGIGCITFGKDMAMSSDLQLEFEQLPGPTPHDETDYSLRGYVARIPEERLAKYDSAWTDEQVREWDGNFRSDGALMLVCCERDVDVEEFRNVVEEFLEFRKARQGK
jgi:hypothetical protein